MSCRRVFTTCAAALAVWLVGTFGVGLSESAGATGSWRPTTYWQVDRGGTIYGPNSSQLPSDIVLRAPIVGMDAEAGGGGYWLAAADGGVFSFGDAPYLGSAANLTLTAPIVGMATDPNMQGYWLVASDGGVFAFGDAQFHGSAAGFVLRAPIVGMAATPDGAGYWLVAADGGVFAFGDAQFHGSAAALQLHAPIVGIAPMRSGAGYLARWLRRRDLRLRRRTLRGGAPGCTRLHRRATIPDP